MLDYLSKQIIKEKPKTSKELFELKRKAALKFQIKNFPKNSAILAYYRKNYPQRTKSLDLYFEKLLRAAPIRSLSGIVAVTVLTKPFQCPGKCIFCPNVSGMPKSYLPDEPAAARAYHLKFNPFDQVRQRIQSLKAQGHKTDKIELIILGGTWSFYPAQYQTWFIKRCFEAANAAGAEGKTQENTTETGYGVRQKMGYKKSRHRLEDVQRENETAQERIVGLTVETRPDYINEAEVKRLRKLGVTRVELGVQSIYDDILRYNKRGHGVAESIKATKLLKDAGFKINYHIMLGLPGSNLRKDEEMFKVLFSDERFQPDWLKIYPTSVLKTAPLYLLWKKGQYHPYSSGQLKELLVRIKQKIPPYVRITRLIRDIPSQDIIAGSEVSNLRQGVQCEMEKRGLYCNCIRCREIREHQYNEAIELVRRDYLASGGKEIFLSFEDKRRRHLYALLRLRIPSYYFSQKKHFIKELNNAALVRELHTYGDIVPLHRTNLSAVQHKGLGAKLMEKAEEISLREFGLQKIAVISGIGVREYYRKLGYKLEGTYSVKKIKNKR